jgi:hypothetical protein
MKKIYIFYFISLLILPHLLHTQTIQGTITDPLTGKGISGLFVAIGDSSTISDSLGHYIIHLSSPSSVVENSFTGKVNLPNEFCLEQNFPNPFNMQTYIKYQLPKSSHIKLYILDLLGQEIFTLVDDEKNAGFHDVKWDGMNKFSQPVGSGIYFIFMQADNFVQTKKILLLK